jgi:TolB protein
MSRHSRRTAAALAAAALAVSMAVGSPVAQANPVPDAADQVPWNHVGDGWTLATWNPVAGHLPGEPPAPDEVPPAQAANTLFLIDAVGRRYAVTTFAPNDKGWKPHLLDWSGDGGRALFSLGDDTVIVVDLHTGNQTSFPTRASARFSRPKGEAIVLAESSPDHPSTLQRVDLAGNVQLTYPTENLAGAGRFGGNYLETPDGTTLVLSTANRGNDAVPRTDNSFVLMGNDGTVGRVLPVPMPGGVCRTTRWLTPTDFVASCTAQKSAGSQLWKVPLDGSAPTALTALNNAKNEPGFDGDYGDIDAWQLPSGTFVQSLGACGVVFLSRVTSDGHTQRVKVPGAGNNIDVVGSSGGSLVLKSTTGCSPSTALMSYDPAANATKVLLGPTVNDGRVVDAMTFGEGYRS